MPTTPEGPTGRRLALVVATAAYGDATLAKLRAPGRDASELAAVLEDAAIGGFEVETVLDASTEALRRRVAHFCNGMSPRDLALIYLSCHGVLDDRGRLYYATTDTDRKLLSATAVPSAWLNEQLEDCRARRQILVLDCCHSGAFAKGAKGEGALALGERFEGRGRVVLTGSRGTEYSFEHDHVVGDGASSVFTSSLIEGMRSGDADLDGDGAITIGELYDYAYDAVREKEARQTPTLWSYGAEGDLLVARSPRGAVAVPKAPPQRAPRPAPAPPPPPSTPSQPPSGPGQPPGGRPPSVMRRRWPIAAATALFGAIALAIVVLGGGGGSEDNLDGGAVPPGAMRVSDSPRGIAVYGGATWVARFDAGEVTAIYSSSRRVPIKVGRHPRSIVAGEGSVWVSYEDDTMLARINPSSRKITERVRVTSGGCDCQVEHLALADGKVWVGSKLEPAIVAFDAETGDPAEGPYEPSPGFLGVFAVGDGELWGLGNNSGPAGNLLFRIGPKPDEIKRFKLSEDSYLSGVTYGHGTVWVADAGGEESLVYPFDPDQEKIADKISLGGFVGDDITFLNGSTFVWDPESGVITQIDAETTASTTEGVDGYEPLGGNMRYQSDFAVDESAVWVTNPESDLVFRVPY